MDVQTKSRLSGALVGGAAVLAIVLAVVAVHRTGASATPAAAGVGTPAATSTAVATSTTTAAPTSTAATTTSASPAARPSSAAPTKAAAPASAAKAPAAAKPTPPLTYTVKQGDTLNAIAAWFKLHGYQALYDANKAVLGANPDMIFPGQTITLSGAGLTTGG